MKTHHTMDLTTGSVTKKLLLFALPILASYVLQHLYNAADKAVVGQFAGKLALGAVGSTGSAITMLLNLFSGLAIGVNVVCSNLRGAHKETELRQCMHTSVLVSFICGLALCIIGQFLTRPLLILLKTPDDVIDGAELYMRIYFAGVPASLLYNYGAGILRAYGDTKRPMIILALSGLVNVALNLVFVIVFNMTVDGVAWATVASQVISAAAVMFILFSSKDEFRLRFHELKIDFTSFRSIIRVGVPCGLNGLVFSISNMILQSYVNSFGSTVLAGNVAADGITGLIYQFVAAFYSACVSFSGQCYGAGKYKRIDKLLRSSLLVCVGTMTVFALFSTFSPRPLLAIFDPDPEVVEAGIPKLTILAWSYIIYAISDMFLGCLRGMRKSGIPTMINAFGICLPRVLWARFIFPLHPTVGMLYICYPISYIISSGAQGLYYFYCRKKLSAANPEYANAE